MTSQAPLRRAARWDGVFPLDPATLFPTPEAVAQVIEDVLRYRDADAGPIAEVGADGSKPSGAEVLDVDGATMTPGLVDAHVHMYSGRFGTNMQERALLSPRRCMATSRC